jgi:hypothetical protein
MDLENLTMDLVVQNTPLVLQRTSLLFQKSVPVRFKGLHYINLPPTMTSFINLVRSFLPEKL